jgi:Ca-activated chloride channel family protein
LVAIDKTPARPTDEQLGSTRLANATPAGSLAFAQGSTGWLRDLFLAAVLLLGSLLLLRVRT